MRSTIILSDDEIRGLLDGTRTQLRRPVRIPTTGSGNPDHEDPPILSPFGASGARLAVREAWQHHDWTDDGMPWLKYRSDGATLFFDNCEADLETVWAELSKEDNFSVDGRAADRRWRSPATMPRWACRYALEVGEVRCQRLQDATEDDAIAEGLNRVGGLMEEFGMMFGPAYVTPLMGLVLRWEDHYGKRYPWASKPWTFTATGRLVAL